ncbi:unnamed protein product [Adineta ricciae]|uniref:Calponin-homology (CH) domain-containing protein n=1 Tax=Adineta ricciae TaxID=249248 RepID=A0A814KJP2_ADIRI|nr:unnamed protein product [Adineta ricciae]
MSSPIQSSLSPTASRLTPYLPATTGSTSRPTSARNQLEESITTLQNEQERVQKKTFTKWVNIYLSEHEPPFHINDLFEDFNDGTKLIALVETLSGQPLPVERGNKRAHHLSNVNNVLKYLESRKIKLVNIRPIDIVDGKPTMILGLVWMLILHYQIEDTNMCDDDSKENRGKPKDHLLEWVRKKTGFYSLPGHRRQGDELDVRDFTTSWRDGLAFNALVHGIRPDLVDLHDVKEMDVRDRLENAFNVAEEHLGVPRLIDAEDVDVNKPDEKSIMTYVGQFSRRFPDLPFGSINKEHGELLRYIADTRERLTVVIDAPIIDIQAEYKDYCRELHEFGDKQRQWKIFERKESKSSTFPGDKLREMKDYFDDIALRMDRWRFKLDTNLPGELGQIADWINTAEEVLTREINFDPMKSSPEENIDRFNQLNEEYTAIFNDKERMVSSFQRIKRDPTVVNKQISHEHLTHLTERLDSIIRTHEEYGRFLDFEEVRWKVQSYFSQLEILATILNKKQGDLNQTESLYSEYKRHIYDEKLLSNLESLLPELLRRAQNYNQLIKKDDERAREYQMYCDKIRRTAKTVSTDLESKQHLLEETISSWRIYHELYDSLEDWLSKGEHMLGQTSEEKNNYFANIDYWSEIHKKVHAAIDRLISFCNDEYARMLRDKLLFINRRWKEVTESVHQFRHDESIKKKRDDFYSGRAKLLDTLDKIDREMQECLPCTAKALKSQENRLYDAQAELEMFNQTVQVLSKLSQTIARESGESNGSTEMNSLLQICFDKLRHVQEQLPNILKRNKVMLGHLQKFDDGLQKCQQWFNDAKQLFSRYSIQVSVKRIEDSLEKHRNFFADFDYYQSLLDTKAKLIVTMKKSTENSVPLNFAPLDEQYKQLADTFEQIRQQASYWEKEFNQHSQLWKDFNQRLRHLEQWIEQAQTIVLEKHEDYAYLIQKHKNFFQIIDDEILHGFIKSGRELLHIRDESEQKEIQFLMDTLESRWNSIVCHAPIRLLRLQYERLESIIVKELKQAEDELNEELKQMERHMDTSDILRRHNERFQLNNFQPTMETHLRNLHAYANDIRSHDTSSTSSQENDQMDERTTQLNDYWARTQTKIDNVKRKLQILPKQRQEFEEKFRVVEAWIEAIERLMNETQNVEVSFEQYKATVNKFKNAMEQVEMIARDVEALSALMNELIEEHSTEDPARYRQRLDALLSRYKQTLVSVDETSQRCTVIVPAKMIHENTQQLHTTLSNISNAPLNFRDLADVRTAVQGQKKVCDVLESFSHQVNELSSRADELMKQDTAPRYVQQDIQNIQKLYEEKRQSAHELLEKLQLLLELWERFDANKRRYQQQMERFNSELSRSRSNLNSVQSYQHEIETCKHLQTSYTEMKTILDDSADHLQAISSKSLLPYENFQKLKTEYDHMVEELVEKARIVNELLRDLTQDNDKWTHFNEELKRLETLFREIGSMFDARMFGERPLEEKQQILERIRSELGEHLHSLSALHSEGSNLQSLHSRPKDLPQALNRLTRLRTLAESTSEKVNREEEQLAECRSHVQASERYIQQLEPWIEQAEDYLTKRLDKSGALNLTEAKQLHDKHKELLEERRRMLLIHNNLINEEHTITDQYELKSFIKALSNRWNEIVRRSDELTPRYDKQYSAWLLFESELNSFRDQILSELEQRVNSIISTDVNKLFDLNKINILLNELRALDENIHHHTSSYNRLHKQLNDLRQFTSPEGQRILHEEQMSIETRWHQLTRLITDKLRETERLYESRKSFLNRFEVFERNVRDITEQIDNNAQIQTATWNQTYQRLQQLLKQLQSLQPLVATISEELTDFEHAGLSKVDLQTIKSAFDANRQRLNTYEIVLQKRLDLLKHYDEHMKYSLDIRHKLQQINDELQQNPQMKVENIDTIKAQLERYADDLRTIQADSTALDCLMEESNATITDSSTNRNIFFVVECRAIQNLVDAIENKLTQRRIQAQELDRLVADFNQTHTNLLQRINAIGNNHRSAHLAGYSIRDIEDLMVVIKTLQREVQGEDVHLTALRNKYKTISSDLSQQERQQAESVLRKIEIDLVQLQEQIDKRKDRLATLIQQRQELEQISNRLIVWYDDKQPLITSDTTVPLKPNEIERLQNRYNDALNEIKQQRTTLDQITRLNDAIKQGYAHEDEHDCDQHTDELVHQLRDLEEALNERNRQLHATNEQRRDYDRLTNKLADWIKSTEQQVKEPFSNDLQQSIGALKDKSKTVQSLLQLTRDRRHEFEDLARLHTTVASTLNETDSITFDEKYTVLKDKYNRLLDNLTQRLALLDEASHERNEFSQQLEHVQELYQQLQTEFNRLKHQSPIDGNCPPSDRRAENYKQLLRHLDETNNSFKELTRIQRLLTSKGHRIDFRLGNELNTNLKNFDESIHNEIERIERLIQTENEFHLLENELDASLQMCTDQLKSSQNQQDKGIIYQSVLDRLHQAEQDLNRLIHMSERLANDLPHSQFEQIKRTNERRRERLQDLFTSCQQVRGEYEHLMKTQHKLNEDLLSTIDWFRRILHDLQQPLELNLSLNNVVDFQQSLKQIGPSIDQRMARIEQTLDEEPNLINAGDGEIRERLETVEELKHQVKNLLNKQINVVDDVHRHMTHYLKLTTEAKAALADSDLKLASFFDGYDRHRLDEHEKQLNYLEEICAEQNYRLADAQICAEQNYRLADAHKLTEAFRLHLRNNAKDLCDSQLRNFHQTIEDLESRIHQRRKELDDIRQKSNRFNSSVASLHSDADRILQMIEKSPDSAENLITEMDSAFSALHYLGRDLKKSLDVNSSTDIDRELKELATSVETIRESLDRGKKAQEENESLRERIERTLSKIKSFTNRKRQELHQSFDSGYGSVDLTRRSVEIKSFMKDIDLESSLLSEVDDMITALFEKRYDQQIVRSLEKKHQDALQDYQNLKIETTKTVEHLDQQVQEQEKLRQNARSISAIIQRIKVQLIEIHPTLTNEADQKLKKIDEELVHHFDLFEQGIVDYKNEFGNLSDDLDKTISRVYEDMEDMKVRMNDKYAELHDFNNIRNDYEKTMDTISKNIDTKTRQANAKLNANLLKELTSEMHSQRTLVDRVQLLSTTLIPQLTDSDERERVRRRVSEIARRWTELEQDLLSKQEDMNEMNHINQQYAETNTMCERWIKQTKDVIHELGNSKNIEIFNQFIPKAKTILMDYQSAVDHIQRLRNRLNRLLQTSKSAEATQKLTDLDRLLKDLSTHHENLEQRLELSQKIHYQLNEFNKQYIFYEQWITNIHRTIESILEQPLTIDEKLQRLQDIQMELDKRKQILMNLTHDYPQIEQIVAVAIQNLIETIDRMKANVARKQEEYEQQNRQQKEFRDRIESIFEWIKQTQRHESLSGQQDLDTLQQENAQLNQKQQAIQEKLKEIDILSRNINNSKLPNDSLQKLRQEIDHLKERLIELIKELENRSSLIKKKIRDVEEHQRRQRLYQDSLNKLSSLVEHDTLAPGRSVEDSLKTLEEQMIKLECENEERERRKRQRKQEWQLYMDEISLLEEKLNTLKQRKLNPQNSIEEQLHFIRSQNQELDHYQQELINLKKQGQTMCFEDGNPIPLPAEIQLIQSTISSLKQQFDHRLQALTDAEHCRDVYLNECKLYEGVYNTTMERLSRPVSLTCTNEDYARQLNEQKSLSQQMDEKRRQLNIFYDKLDRETRARYSKQHFDLEKRSNDLQDKITQRNIHGEYLLRIWKEYQIRLNDICYQLDQIEKQIPLNKRLFPFQQIQSTFALYKELNQRILILEPEVLHLNDEIQMLCSELNILSLQTEIQNVTQNFSRIANDIQEKYENHKTGTVFSTDIKRNLAILEDTLGQCASESTAHYDGNLSELRVQLERMMDVEKRLDNVADVYSHTLSLVKRLSTYNLYDLKSTESHLECLHQKWTAIKTDILRHENILHQNIINSLPTRQARKEMVIFIDTIKRLLDDDHGAPINNKETLQKLLKRYRDMRVDVLNHQRTIDYLNESFQQEANVDETTIDYMENIKQINIDWTKIKSLISARIDTLEQLNDQFNDFDHTIRTLSDWVQEQTSDLEFMRTRTLEAGVKHNIKKCNEMENQLITKQQILSSLKTSSSRMASSSSTFRIIDQDGTIQSVRYTLDNLSPSIEQLKLKSKSILNDWQEYNRVLLKMEKILQEAEAEIDRIETSAMNVETYEMSTRKAQDYLQAMDAHRHDFDQIKTHTHQLSDQCDKQTSTRINELTHRIQQQWTSVKQHLQDILKPSREVVDNWRQFNTSYLHLLDRLGELEARWYTIQKEKFTSDIDSLLDKARVSFLLGNDPLFRVVFGLKDFQQSLQQLDTEVLKLHERAKKLSSHLCPIAAKKIDTQYAVIHNQYSELQNFQNKLLTDCNELKHREKIYLDYLNELTHAINQTQAVLKSQQLNGENDLHNLKQLRELDQLLQSKHDLIERLNSNEFILYIKRARQLHELMIEYSQCVESVKNRIRQIEANEYGRLNFDKRCQKWHEYIQAIEKKLTVVQENLPTNYHGLIEIDKNLSNIATDFSQRQQELIQLINEGKQLVENPSNFIKLEQRWQNVMRAVTKQHEEIKELIRLWLAYQTHLENYYRLLRNKCEKQQQELQTANISKIAQIKQGSYVTTIDNDELKALLDKIYEANRRLIKHSDVKTQAVLEKEWNDLQKSLHEIQMNIKQKCETLVQHRTSSQKEKSLLRFSELDRTLDELTNLVKSVRTIQQQPTDDLTQFLQRCHNKNHELTQRRPELYRARQAISEISPELHSEDTRQLIQKLNLLEIQWGDAERILIALIDSLTKRRSEYQDFEQKSLRLIQWYEHFRSSELNERLNGLTLQVTVDVLKNDIRNLLGEKRRLTNDLLVQARLLQSQSSDQIFKSKIDQLEQIMNTTEQYVEKKIKKNEMTLKMFNDFEHGTENIRSWLDLVEGNLQKQQLTNDLPAYQQFLASIESDIENNGPAVTNLLTLGHNLLQDPDIHAQHADSITRTVQSVEQRWRALRDLLTKRRFELDSVQDPWRDMDEAIRRATRMVSDHEEVLAEIKRTSANGLQGVQDEYRNLENLQRKLDNDDKDIQQIAKVYSDIIHTHPKADTKGEKISRIKDLSHRWEVLNSTVHESMKNLKYMLSIHGDFQLTQDSLVVWLADLEVVLTNLEHLSEAPLNNKLQQLDDIEREILEKLSKIEYVQTCANHLLNKTVDARGLTIDVNQLSKFCQQLTDLIKRIKTIKQKLINANDRHLDLMSASRASPTPLRPRSPVRPIRPRDRFLRPYDPLDFGDRLQRADELLADFEDILLQINSDFRSKEENLYAPTPSGMQLDHLPDDFSYTRLLISTHRKIEALDQILSQIRQELGAYLIQDLSNDPAVLDIFTKWPRLQLLASNKDEELSRHRLQWRDFRRQLDHLEHATQQFSNLGYTASRTTSLRPDAQQQFNELQTLLQSTTDQASQFNDHSNEWALVDHRLQALRDRFHNLSSSKPRDIKISPEANRGLIDINCQLDHLELLIHSLEPVEDSEINQNVNRTKLHRFIRIHDDLEILHGRLITLNERPLSATTNDQIRLTNDSKFILDRLNAMKRVVKIYLEQLEKFLATRDLNQSLTSSKHSSVRTSNNNLEVIIFQCND